MNKVIWGILVVAIIIALGVFFLSKNYQSAVPAPSVSSAEPLATESVAVTYSDSGFSPAAITVKAGNTVIFKNQSSRNMWVASDPHPIHTDYPEFDAKKGIAMGESYSFTFTKTGTWKYHNHLKSSDTGTVIVE